MQRIAFVYPASIKKDSFFGFVLPSLALERLAAAVEDIAECALFDARFEKDLINEVARFRPDIICVNVKTTVYSKICYDAARALKNSVPGVIIVLGGLHASSCPEEALEHGDYVICGEGEISFRKFVEGDAPENIGGLVYKTGGATVKNKKAAPPADMDILKPPARHLRKPYYNYSAAGLIKMDLLETSRGCTHFCSFCSPASLYPAKYRTHSPEYVFKQIEALAAAGVKYCMLTDDHFGGDLSRVEKICDLIINSGIRIAFFCFIRPFAGEIELKKKMVRAGFVMVSYGAESPDPTQLARYGKGFGESAGFIKKVNREWLTAGACYVGNSFVFGDVNDSAETIASLGKFARGLDPTYIEPLYSQPFAGTKYRESLQENNMLIEERGWEYFTEGRMLVRHPQLNEEELKRLRAKMWVDFFSPKKAAGVFRVPLYFYNTLNIPLIKVLKYMKACDYSVFGCILEDKFYEDLHYEMIDDYFGRAIKEFGPEELDMTEKFDEFTNMLKLGWLKNVLDNHDIVINLSGGGNTVLASLGLKIRNKKIMIARVEPGPQKYYCEPCAQHDTVVLRAPMFLLKPSMAAGNHAVKVASVILIFLYNAVFSNFSFKFAKAVLKKIFASLYF
ncbi:MAG: hypothetical protein A2008_12005 [Candidatus Wallbacteria bacterium GWC2_49_35]|uniref:Uncharacterized protein n=1 Tax=Candidatus Wallbacteria bacterium GWC2_49_35 TaxID=1817813 RepID=A0A1F7WZJ6_9BACT|nr:MAG: hypothetical protein A2008_12005 [Candidatus Wallbacteria bacterium GWC2_49_35]HBC76795.1 hypothetical protein [Candidatus Wallbacteria bacterium]